MIPLPYKLGAGILLLGIVGGVAHHKGYTAGKALGRAQVTADWQDDTRRRDAADAAIRAENAAKEAAAAQRNDEVINDYTTKLAAATASRDDYYRLLQRARNQVRPQSAPEVAGPVSPAPASEADIAERIDRAVADALAESRANADQLDALIEVVKGQM